MSVATLYSNFDQAIKAQQNVDLLGSEIGGSLKNHLDKVPPVKALLGGEDWDVANGALDDEETVQVDQPIQMPVMVQSARDTRKRFKRQDPLTGQTYGQKKIVVHHSIQLRLVHNYVDVVTGFTLDGEITDQIRFFGYFWDDHGTLKYYCLFRFQNAFVDTFFENAYWPERADLALTRPQILVFSHQTNAFHCNWGPGVYFMMDLALGDNLEAAAEDHDALLFGGPIWIDNDQYAFDFSSWPTVDLKFDGGNVTIEGVRLYAGTAAWEDGEPPRTIEGDPEEEDADDGSPDPHDVQFSLQGYLKIKEDHKPRVWSPLPKDDGVIVWNLTDGTKKLPAVTDLDPLLGEQAWVEPFGSSWDNWVLKELALAAQLPDRSLSSASYVLTGTVDVSNAAPGPVTIQDAEIQCSILGPASQSRQEIVEITGTVEADGATFEAHLSIPELVLELASVDGEGFAQWSQSFWYQRCLQNGEFENGDIEDTYDSLFVRADLGQKKFWATVSNEAGDSREI